MISGSDQSGLVSTIRLASCCFAWLAGQGGQTSHTRTGRINSHYTEIMTFRGRNVETVDLAVMTGRVQHFQTFHCLNFGSRSVAQTPVRRKAGLVLSLSLCMLFLASSVESEKRCSRLIYKLG